MTTKRKSETARINGARSRGPVTAEGKQIASQNAIRHGMLAQTVVLEGESDELFQQLTGHTKGSAGLIVRFRHPTK